PFNRDSRPARSGRAAAGAAKGRLWNIRPGDLGGAGGDRHSGIRNPHARSRRWRNLRAGRARYCARGRASASSFVMGAGPHRRAGYRMTEHLLQNGCRRVAFAYRPGAAPTVEARQAGYREALWRHSITGELPLETDGTDIHIIERFIRSARPDGVVCANDLTA